MTRAPADLTSAPNATLAILQGDRRTCSVRVSEISMTPVVATYSLYFRNGDHYRDKTGTWPPPQKLFQQIVIPHADGDQHGLLAGSYLATFLLERVEDAVVVRAHYREE